MIERERQEAKASLMYDVQLMFGQAGLSRRLLQCHAVTADPECPPTVQNAGPWRRVSRMVRVNLDHAASTRDLLRRQVHIIAECVDRDILTVVREAAVCDVMAPDWMALRSKDHRELRARRMHSRMTDRMLPIGHFLKSRQNWTVGAGIYFGGYPVLDGLEAYVKDESELWLTPAPDHFGRLFSLSDGPRKKDAAVTRAGSLQGEIQFEEEVEDEVTIKLSVTYCYELRSSMLVTTEKQETFNPGEEGATS